MIVYGYGRHSTDKQGLTEEAQRQKVEAYIQLHLPDAQYGGWLYDTAVSGGKPLFERPKGRELWALVQPGDHIVVAKLDRAFRRTIDGLRSLEMLEAKKVFIQSADRQLDTSTAIGRAAVTITLAFAQLDRDQASERTRDAMEVKRKAGLPTDGTAPIGWCKVGKGKASRFEPCVEERDQVETIVNCRALGWSYEDLVEQLRKQGVRRWNGRRWNRNSARAAVSAYEAGFPKIRPEPRRRSSA
jgi:DNA invertase Pin-like site-specific DNA recombinase